jgi:hypothetical protein
MKSKSGKLFIIEQVNKKAQMRQNSLIEICGAIEQNIEYFYENGADFSTLYKLL